MIIITILIIMMTIIPSRYKYMFLTVEMYKNQYFLKSSSKNLRRTKANGVKFYCFLLPVALQRNFCCFFQGKHFLSIDYISDLVGCTFFKIWHGAALQKLRRVACFRSTKSFTWVQQISCECNVIPAIYCKH